MNYSKKVLLSLLIITQTSPLFCAEKDSTVTEQDIVGTVERIKNIPTYISDLPTSDVVVSGIFAVLGAAASHVCVCAVAHLLDKNTDIELSFFHPEKWGISLWLGTVGGAAVTGYLSLTSFGPKFLAQQINQPLLTAVMTTKPYELKNSLDNLYVSNRFPRAAAFRDLDALKYTLSALLESFTKLKGKAGYAEAKRLTPTIMAYIANVKDTMLTIKNDPRWLEECNASTLAMTQANIQGHQNAQLAGTMIQLAHSR